MSSLLEHYKVLGISFGAGVADVTSSYRRLCRLYHPDVSPDPEAEELMKKINVAYTVLRERFKREAAMRERHTTVRSRRYGTETRNAHDRAQNAQARLIAEEGEKAAFSVLEEYFSALLKFDYIGAYNMLTGHDRRYVPIDAFAQWRKAVARLHPMQAFKIAGGFPVATISMANGKTQYGRKFLVTISEQDVSNDAICEDIAEKLVVYDDGEWKVFLGYSSVRDLTRKFDEGFESKRRKDAERHRQEYSARLHSEYNMLSHEGLKKEASREIYRQKRFGGAMTFAALKVTCGAGADGEDALRRLAAKTICAALRETDIPAYVGDGVFALLLVELQKKNAKTILSRLSGLIEEKTRKNIGRTAEISYEFRSWNGNKIAELNELSSVLKKFQKKI